MTRLDAIAKLLLEMLECPEAADTTPQEREAFDLAIERARRCPVQQRAPAPLPPIAATEPASPPATMAVELTKPRPVPRGPVPHVYFIGAVGSGHVKIGTTNWGAKSRLASLQAGSPLRLRVIAVIDGDDKVERALHRRFKTHRVHREWFRLDGELAEYVAALPPWSAT